MGKNRFPLGDGRKHQDWPEDMTDTLALMSPIPSQGVNGDFPRDSPYWDDFDSFLEGWKSDLRDSFSPILGDQVDDLEFNYYLRPPAAGPYIDFIYTLAENIDWIVQKAGGYIGVGGALIAFAKRRRKRLDTDGSGGIIHSDRTYFFTTARGVEAMCLHHAVHTYGYSDGGEQFQISSTSRRIFNGDVSHPLPGVTFTVSIRFGILRYVYVVDSNARVLEHFVMEPDRIHGLSLPDWLGELEDWNTFEATDLPELDLGPNETGGGEV